MKELGTTPKRTTRIMGPRTAAAVTEIFGRVVLLQKDHSIVHMGRMGDARRSHSKRTVPNTA